jgi:hypothetical protein
MTMDVSQLVLFGIFCSAIHWLIARSEIARPFWSRADGWLGRLLACAGCSGFWIGAVIGGAGLTAPLALDVAPILGVDIALRALAHAVLGVFVTPVFESVLLWGLHESAIVVDEPAEPEPTGSVPRSGFDSGDEIHTPVSNPSRAPKPPRP